MAVPKRRKSQGSRDQRRAQHMKMPKQSLSNCPQCKQAKQPHRVCTNCGFYKGKEVVKMDD